MSNKTPDPFQTIDPTALAQVSGGSASSDDAVLNALNGVLDSIKSLSNQQSQGGFGPTEMMLFMMMLQGRNQPPYVQAAPGVQPFVCGDGYAVVK